MSDTYKPDHVNTNVFAKVGMKCVCFNNEGQILFMKRSESCTRAGGWDFPGGGLDLGEQPEEGIKREILEESGLVANTVTLVSAVSLTNAHKEFVVMIGYVGEIGDTSTLQLSWEHTQYRWVDTKEAINMKLPKFHKSLLLTAIKSRS